MTDKEIQARKRLAKKLTALRKTLRKDERDVLDQIVAGITPAEVEGHSASFLSPSYTLLESGDYSAESAAV